MYLDWNICSVLLENGCSEIGKIEGEVFFPREKFPFPRSDSCLAERSEGRQSRSRKRKVLSRKRRAWDFFYRRVTFFSSTDTFSLALDPWLTISLLLHILWTSISLTFYRVLERALRALASSSGGAACPGGTRGQPGDQPPESGDDSKAI